MFFRVSSKPSHSAEHTKLDGLLFVPSPIPTKVLLYCIPVQMRFFPCAFTLTNSSSTWKFQIAPGASKLPSSPAQISIFNHFKRTDISVRCYKKYPDQIKVLQPGDNSKGF